MASNSSSRTGYRAAAEAIRWLVVLAAALAPLVIVPAPAFGASPPEAAERDDSADADASDADAADADPPDEGPPDEPGSPPLDNAADPEPSPEGPEGPEGPDDGGAVELAPPSRSLPDVGAGGACEIEDAGDPLFAVMRTLDTLGSAGAKVEDCRVIEDLLQGRSIEARLRGGDEGLVLFMLEQTATEGYVVDMAPIGTRAVLLKIQPSRTGERGVRYRGVDRSSVFGRFLPGDDAQSVESFLGTTVPRFFPADVSARLATLGYSVVFHAVARGEVSFEVQPGRMIRRVRVYGTAPLEERALLRSLSVEARPGALARGRCVPPASLRGKGARPPLCGAADLACRSWEAAERERVERFLFDQGYLDGRATLGLACGRAADEADLHVYLDKGKAYKIARNGLSVQGAPAESDRQWVKRQFTPRVLLFLRKRVTRDFIDGAQKSVESTYADPSAYGRIVRSDDRLPYPQVQVRTSFDELDPVTRENVPQNRNLPLTVELDLGRAVETSFSPPLVRRGEDTEARRKAALRFSKRVLDGQLQLFKRREQPNPAVARREAANLRVFYQSRGHPLARIEGFYEDFGELHKLRFEIEEGPRATIKQVTLQAPRGVPPAVRRAVEERWISERQLRRGRSFSEAGALADLGAVLSAYQSAGYLCAGARIRLAFWPEGLERPGEHALLDLEQLVVGGSSPAWLEQFDPVGIAALGEARRIPIYLHIEVEAGPRVLTSGEETVRYLEEPVALTRRVLDAPATADPAWGARRILHDTPLRRPGSDDPGDVPVSPELGRETRRAVISKYRDNGFPVADAELTFRYRRPGRGGEEVIELASPADLIESDTKICQARARDLVLPIEPVIHVYEGRRGSFGDVSFRGNFKTQRYIFSRELEYAPGDDYNEAAVERSLAQMQGTDTIDGAQVSRYPVGCDLDEPAPDEERCTVHQVVTVQEKKDYAFDLRWGGGVQTLNPLYLKLAPRFPNIFGTGVDLDFEGLWGFDLPLEDTAICEGLDCYERRATGTLLRPRLFGTGVSMDITGQFSRRVTPARGQIDAIFGNLRFQWTADPGFSFFTGYLIQRANLSKDLVKPLGGSTLAWRNRREGIVSDLTGLLQLYGSWTNADNPFNPNRGIIVAVEGRLASPYLGGRDWWGSFDLNFRQFVPIPRTGQRLNFRYSLAYGHLFPFEGPLASTDTVPEVFRYYGGGTADLGLRGILPETMLVDLEEVPLPNGGVLYRPRAQGGHLRAIGTVALQVVSVKDFLGGALAHSLFYDFGVLAQDWSQVSLARDLRHSVGVNFLKWDVDVVTIALGYGVLVPVENNVRPTDDRNGRFVFDVGVTF